MPAYAHAGIDDHAAVGSRDKRIDVELGDCRQLDGETREAVEDGCERVGVERRLAPEAVDEPARLSAHNELLGVDVGQRRDAERGLPDQLGKHAARAEADEGPEDRILDDADEELRVPEAIVCTTSGAPIRSAAASK